jgi:hypothetical protein
MRMRRLTRLSTTMRWAALVALVAGCGGGGGGGSGGSAPPAPSSLHYPTCCGPIWVGFAMSPLTPTVMGQVTSWTVSPALPAGITLNPSTGVVSGTHTDASSNTSYRVTAANVSGSSTTSVTFAVSASAIAYQYTSYEFAPGVAAQILQRRAAVPY